MPDISVTVNGMHFPNPFLIGSGPPGTNENMIAKAFDEGWGGVVAKTICLDASIINNVVPRYGKIKSDSSDKEVIGFENIELISDRDFGEWEKEFRSLKRHYPKNVLIASIMESYEKTRWEEIVKRCEDCGVDGFELNLSCPHGLPERQMGAAMGQDPQMIEEVCGWVAGATKLPVWAKMTPNITSVSEAAGAARRGGATGVSAINTILCVIGIDMKTLRPQPTVEGYSTAGGYSGKAVRPIAVRMVMEIARDLPGFPISGIGGIEKAEDAVQFILVGASTVQVCTAAMLHGFGIIHELCDGLKQFMSEHRFDKIGDFRGYSLPYFTTHHDLVDRQAAARAAKKPAVKKDHDWKAAEFTEQTRALVSNEGDGKGASAGATSRSK